MSPCDEIEREPIVHIEALPRIFSSSWELGGITVVGASEALVEGEVRMPMFIAMDLPHHTQQRRAVAPAFTPSEIARMKAAVALHTGAVLDALPVGEAFDWVERVSIELTTGMLARLFDFPWDQRAKLTGWSDALGDVEAFDTLAKRQARLMTAFEMGSAFHALWESKKGQPLSPDLIAVEDVELDAHHIRKGDRLALWYVSANRDESVFPDGNRVVVDRDNARRHLSFGYGIHRCVGARVAELQLVTLLEEMARRRLRVHVLAEPERVPACFVNGYRSMQVELERY